MASKSSSNADVSNDEEGGTKENKDITPIDHHKNCFLSSIVLIFLAPGLGGFMYGYDIGASSYAISAFSDQEFWTEDNEWRIGLFASITTIAAFVGSLIIYPIADKIGRRKELIFSSTMYIVGALWQASPAIYARITPMLMLPELVMTDALFWHGYISGRFLYGLGIGITMHGAPAYLGEMIPPTIRGALLSLKEVFIVLGMLAGYLLGYLLAGNDNEENQGEESTSIKDNWAYAYIFSVSISLTMFILLQFFLPYSFRWLLSRGRSDEALESLRFLYKPEYVEEQYQKLIKSTKFLLADKSTEDDGRKPTGNVFDPKLQSSLIAGFGLVILQQISGQPSVLKYVQTIFDDLGISSIASVLVALFKVLSTMVSFFMVEKYGRKLLLFLGCALMLIGTVTLIFLTDMNSSPSSQTTTMEMMTKVEEYDNDLRGAALTTTEELDSRNICILIAMFIYIGGYQIGFGPITWLTMSEVFPLSIRSQALSIAVQFNFLLNGAIEFAMALLQNSLGLSNTFAIFSIILIYALYFIHRHVLETKGLTLEEIEVLYSNKNSMRKKRKGSSKPTSAFV